MPFYSNAEFAEKFVEEVMHWYCSDDHSNTQEEVARRMTDKYHVEFKKEKINKVSLIEFTVNDIREITQSTGFSHRIKPENSSKQIVLRLSKNLRDKIDKANPQKS